jgi:VWFA-related protein
MEDGMKQGLNFCVLVLVWVLVAPVAGSQEEPIPVRTFSGAIDVRVVSVEVSVTDRQGQPVLGLTPEDFELYEDGKEVGISHFYACHDLFAGTGEASMAPVAAAAAAPEQEQDIAVDRDLYLVIYFDETNISPSGRRTAVKHLQSFLEGDLPDNLWIMVATYDGSVQESHPFTADPSELLPVIEQLKTGKANSLYFEKQRILAEMQSDLFSLTKSPGGGADYKTMYALNHLVRIQDYGRSGMRRNLVSIDALSRFIEAFSGLPGRKHALYIGDGIDGLPGEDLLKEWVQVFPGVAESKRLQPSIEAQRFSIVREVEEVIRFASHHRVIVSKLDTTGDDRLLDAINVESKGKEYIESSDLGSLWRRPSIDATISLAEATGGRSLVNNSQLAEQLTRITRELDCYYSLGYQIGDADDRHRDIKVRVKRDGVRLSYIQGLQYRDEDSRFADMTRASLQFGITKNRLGLELQAEAQQVREDGTYTVPLSIGVPLQYLVLLDTGLAHEGQVTILVTARDEEGGLAPIQRRQATVQVESDDLAAAANEIALFTVDLAMAAGPHRIAVGVRDEYGKVEATSFLDLVVGGTGVASAD